MPLDSRMYDDYDIFRSRAVWYLKFAWLPKRCYITNKLIWLKLAYKGTAMYTGPGDPIFEHHWVEKNEYLIAKLKNLI